MPSAQIIVRQANGQTLVLSSEDRVVKEITIQCESLRCAARHNKKIPVEFTFDDQGAFPEAGDSFLSLILPERSPSNPGAPRCFCSAQCLKDYLTYQFLAPGPRQPEVIAGNLAGKASQELVAGEKDRLDPVRKTYFTSTPTITVTPADGTTAAGTAAVIPDLSEPVAYSISQADGEGENPSGPRFL